MNLVKSKLKYEEKKKQEQKQKKQGNRLYSTRYSIQTKEKKSTSEDTQTQEEEEYEEEEEELKEQYKNIKKLWNDLGVTKEFQKVFEELSKKLSKKLKKEYYDYEMSQLNKFRDNLIKLSKNITSREKTIYLLKELDINYFQEITKDKPNTSILDKITGDIVQAIKHLRIHSVNAVNHMAKIRDICSYNIICGKYDLDKINKIYCFDKNYLIKMKFDLDFLKDTHLAELFDFSEESDPFLLNLSPDEEEIKKEEERKKKDEEERKRKEEEERRRKEEEEKRRRKEEEERRRKEEEERKKKEEEEQRRFEEELMMYEEDKLKFGYIPNQQQINEYQQTEESYQDQQRYYPSRRPQKKEDEMEMRSYKSRPSYISQKSKNEKQRYEEEVEEEKRSKISQGINTEDIEKKNEENQEENKQKDKDGVMEGEEKQEGEEEKKKKKIQMTLDLLRACKQCEFIIMQDLLFYQIQSEKAEQEAKSRKPQKIKLGQSFKGNLTQSINKNRKKKEYEMLFYQSQMYRKDDQERKKDEIQPMTSEELLEKLDEYERKRIEDAKKEEENKDEEEKEIRSIKSEEERRSEEEARKKEEEEKKKKEEEEEERRRKEEEEREREEKRRKKLEKERKMQEEERKRQEEERKRREEEEERKRREEEEERKRQEEEERKRNEYKEGDKLLYIGEKIVFDKNQNKEDKEMEKQMKYVEQTLRNFEKYYGKPEENKQNTEEEEEERKRKKSEQYMHKNQTIKEEENHEEKNEKDKKDEDKIMEELKYDEENKEEIEKQIESMKKNDFSTLHPENFKVSFFSKDFYFFTRDYNEYYSDISEEQKTTFHIEKDISLFTSGISPKILYCHPVDDPNKLIGICGVSLSHPIYSVTKLNINHISALGEDWGSIFKAFIMFIKENFKYNEINLLLYYKIHKNITYEINKEIMSLFKDELKFKWSKIENHSDEMRRQEIILLSEKSDNESNENEIGAINININSVISLGKKPYYSTSLDDDLNSKYMNEFLAIFAVNTLKENSYELHVSNSNNNNLINWEIECVKKFLTYTNLNFETTTDMKQVKNALGDEIEIPEDSEEFTYVKYGLLPQLYSNVTSKYDGFIYNRFEIESFGILRDKQNDVTIYVIPTSDRSISILVCEVTKHLQKILLENYSSSLYEQFNSYVESINNEEKVNDKKYFWLPSFEIDTHLSSSSLKCLSDIQITKNLEKTNITNVDEYLKIQFKGDDKMDVGFIVEPQEEDIVIKNSFLFAIANDGVCKNLNIPVISLMNITKDNWTKA